MRLFFAFLLILPLSAFSQEEKDKKILGFGVETAFNLFDEPTLSFAEYSAVVDDPSFFIHAETAELTKSSKLFNRNGIGLRLILKGPDNKNLGVFKRSRFNIGAQYNGGNNYSFNYHETSRIRVDTVTLTGSQGIQTLYRDTVYYTETRYSARSRNIGVFGEYLIYTGEGMPAFATGIGLAGDVTFFYQAEVMQRVNTETGLYDLDGAPVYADVIYDPSIGATGYGGLVNFEWMNPINQRLKPAFFIRPYIPVRIETRLSNRPKLSNFTVDINAKIGTEVQIDPGASVNARMFYSLGLGLNLYL